MTIPQQIGRYDIAERIGSGGFATVWRGYDPELSDDVAIKVLAAHWNENPSLRERFIEEARVMRRADSDHIVRVYDIGTLDDGRPYFVMSYADHGTLAERLPDGGLPIDIAVRIATDAARAVGYLHDLGFAHRDIKPSNILFRSTPLGEQMMIADLGLARAIAEGSSTTIVAGTPGYMAPEQAYARAAPDQRTDVYALGALTYHLLTGTIPTPGGIGAPPPPPSSRRFGLPPDLDAVVLRALEPDRAARWPDASTLAGALQAIPVPRVPQQAPVPSERPAAPPAAQDGSAPDPTVADTGEPAETEIDQGDTGGTSAPAPPWERRPGPQPARRPSRRRRVLTASISGGLVLMLAAGILISYRLHNSPTRMVDISGNAISASVPANWNAAGTTDAYQLEWSELRPFTTPAMKDRPSASDYGLGAEELTTVPEDPDTLAPTTGLDRDLGITVIATWTRITHNEVFDIEHAPKEAWPPVECDGYRDGYARSDHPAHAKKDLRTWKAGDCDASGHWYAHGVIIRDDYAVDVFMVADPGQDTFEKVMRSVKVDIKDLPN